MTTRNELILTLNACLLADRLDFGRALAADWLASWPGDFEVQHRLADMELRQDLIPSAAHRLEQILARNPEYAQTYPLLAYALKTQGDSERSMLLETIGRILDGQTLSHDGKPDWTLHLQMMLHAYQAEDLQSALALAATIGAVNTALSLPSVVHVRTLLKQDRTEDAYSLGASCLDRWPDCIPFQLVSARADIAAGRISSGVALLHQAASADPLGELSAEFLGESHPYQSLWPETLSAEINRPIPADVTAYLGGNQLGGMPSPQETGDFSTRSGQTTSSLSGVDAGTMIQINEMGSSDTKPVSEVESGTQSDLPTPESWEAFQGPDAGDGLVPKGMFQQDSEVLEATKKAFDDMASRLKSKRYRKDIDVRIPAYIVLTSRSRLVQHFGDDVVSRIDEAVMQLVEAVRSRSGWSAYRLYVDDPATLSPFGLTPADPGNAWEIKMRLADLDKVLAKRGEMVGSVFIIGSDEIIPFHRLPNPTDDDDDEIPSDNPYTTGDNNYLAPEWPVGRLPLVTGEALVDAIRSYVDFHQLRNTLRKPFARFRLWLRSRVRKMITSPTDSIGYSASIWRKASLAVYKSIGDAQSLVITPPVHADKLPSAFLHPTRFSYFNLHGLEDAPEWFGQRDPMEKGDSIDFPVALRPMDVIDRGRAPQIIFSEACYGANTLSKTSDTSLSLKFLTSGTRSFVGSTKISYGSVTTPLIAADLLGRYFWEGVRTSTPVGEAFRRAKLNLASEMHQRQGFLDAEDQKTLISFVLFGDPLYEAEQRPDLPGAKVILRKTTRPTRMKTANTLISTILAEDEFDAESLSRVKSIVAAYLPGMSAATCTIRSQHYMDAQSKDAILNPIGTVPIERLSPTSGNAYVFTFSKSITSEARLHQHYARLTMNAEGKIIKLAVSR
ncbi:MAG: hypothetical protein JXA97_08495 [Anaerolineales bacterium]|nr:hypothetical protein [Anaerolineales bacterium]